MTGFTVTPQELRAVSRTMHELHDRFEAQPNLRFRMDAKETSDDNLSRELESFQGESLDCARRLQDDLAELRSRLGLAADGYEEAESDAVDRINALFGRA
ncbi:hypothetical protein [Amycolatopsis nigrescens]|uniref:hypothetical protein n=1 Tax=Amycolatopsis nigrescens TaxID=381445 RepID=UPI00036E7F61|nr:hypothetical protein [Amycolatopsis nigrescens]